MRTLLVLLLTAALLGGPILPAQSGSGPAAAIGMVNEVCTGEAISPYLFITASHCTRDVGELVRFYIRDGVAKREYLGINVWDSYYDQRDKSIVEGLDLSIVRLIGGGEFKNYLSFYPRIPAPDTPGLNIGMSIGLEYWTAPVRIQRMYHDVDLGWILVYRGDIYPGVSGGVVLVDGKIVGIVTHGLRNTYPGIHMGATAGRIMAAIRDLNKHGEMSKDAHDSIVRGPQN
jgi:hypothetical protein